MIETTNHSELLIPSPKPGVSTTVNFSLTPRSSISHADVSIFKVDLILSKSRKIMQPSNMEYPLIQSREDVKTYHTIIKY